MARIRSVKPAFFVDEELQDLEIANPGACCMLVFAGLWGHCSKDGVFEYRPRTLKLHLLPFLEFEMVDTLALLEGAGFINRFCVDGKEYGFVLSFQKHQRISGKEAKASPSYPLPSGESPTDSEGSAGELPPEAPGNTEEAPGNEEGSTGEAPEKAGKGKGKGKGKEEDKTLQSSSNAHEIGSGDGGEMGLPLRTPAELAYERCWDENEAKIRILFPIVAENFAVEREKFIARYRGQFAPVDPYPKILSWCQMARPKLVAKAGPGRVSPQVARQNEALDTAQELIAGGPPS